MGRATGDDSEKGNREYREDDAHDPEDRSPWLGTGAHSCILLDVSARSIQHFVEDGSAESIGKQTPEQDSQPITNRISTALQHIPVQLYFSRHNRTAGDPSHDAGSYDVNHRMLDHLHARILPDISADGEGQPRRSLFLLPGPSVDYDYLADAGWSSLKRTRRCTTTPPCSSRICKRSTGSDSFQSMNTEPKLQSKNVRPTR